MYALHYALHIEKNHRINFFVFSVETSLLLYAAHHWMIYFATM